MIYLNGNVFRQIRMIVPFDREECGILYGKNGHINRIIKMKNVYKEVGRFQFDFVQKMMAFSNIIFKAMANTIIIWHTHKSDEKMSREDIKNAMSCSLIPGRKIFHMIITKSETKIYKIEKEKDLYFIFEQQFKVV